MLSFLAPGYLIVAAVAAAGLVAAHFIIRRHPRAMTFPTARFVPEAAVLTTGWARVPTDLALLALRVLCVGLAGLALSGPLFHGNVRASAKVILADRSRAVADSGEVSDSVAAIRAPGDVVLGYGSGAFEEGTDRTGGSGPVREVGGRGSLSAGLVAAVRAASRFRDRADSVELVIVSSFAAEELDAATTRVRHEWPGRARLVAVSAPPVPERVTRPVLVSGAGDPFAVALSIADPVVSAEVRVVREMVSGADSLWVSQESGRVLVYWPRSVVPAGFSARAEAATVGGLMTESQTMVVPLQRRWQYVPVLGSRPVALWIDGDVAAAETAHGRGCIRSVAVPVSGGGDFVLRPDFHSVVRDLLAPCGGARAYARMPAPALTILAGAGQLAAAEMFAQPRSTGSPATKWLLLAALACALLELVARRRGTSDSARKERIEGVGGEPDREVA